MRWGVLHDLRAEVKAGIGSVVLVVGEQGVGKSSLLRAGLGGAEDQGCRLLWGSADELGQRIPLWLMSEVVSAVERVPASLASAIQGRVGALAEDAVRVLRWGALLGVEFSVRDLEVVSGRSAGELMPVVDGAVGAGVLVEAGMRLGFRHGLIRQVLYEGMPAGLRAALHLQAARMLAGEGAAPERVAAQLVSAGLNSGARGQGEHDWVAAWLADAAQAPHGRHFARGPHRAGKR